VPDVPYGEVRLLAGPVNERLLHVRPGARDAYRDGSVQALAALGCRHGWWRQGRHATRDIRLTRLLGSVDQWLHA